jgi:hypothetical protein
MIEMLVEAGNRRRPLRGGSSREHPTRRGHREGSLSRRLGRVPDQGRDVLHPPRMVALKPFAYDSSEVDHEEEVSGLDVRVRWDR